jgi:pyroglutamyl-peptidase
VSLLLTAFGPFGRFTQNPSEEVAKVILDRSRSLGIQDVVVHILPVEYEAAGQKIRGLIRDVLPDLCICLGVDGGRDTICIESVARNRDDSNEADNAGKLGVGAPILAGGLESYSSNLPLLLLQRTLSEQGLRSTISVDAGGYVCNHVFYLACHEVALLGLNTRYGFIHIPSSYKPDVLVEGLWACLLSLPEFQVKMPGPPQGAG